MIVPLIHTTVAGIHVEGNKIRWVHIALLQGKLTGLRWQEQNSYEELAESVDAARVELAASIPANQLRAVIIEGSSFDDPEEFDAWISAETQQLLPSGIEPSNFTTSPQVLSHSDEGMRCLLLIARKEALQLPVLEESGFLPTTISSPYAGLHRLLHVSGYTGDEAVLLLQENTLLFFSAGGLAQIESITAQTQEELLAEVDYQLSLQSTAEKTLLVAGVESDAFTAFASTYSESGYTIQTFTVKTGKTRLPAEFVPAAALAIAATIPGCTNLQDPLVSSENKIAVSKAAALWVILRTGIALGALLLIATAGLFASDYFRVSAEEEQAALSHQLSRIEAARDEVQALQGKYERAKRLSVTRSMSSVMLARITELMPREAWITSIQYGEIVEIQGYALGRKHVNDLLSAFEGASNFKNTQLIRASEVHRDKAFRNVKRNFQQDQITAFEITFEFDARQAPGSDEHE